MATTVVSADREAQDVAWRHVPALDGLRAIAVVGVLLFHGGYLQGGFLGVDLFFALSGFLITSLLVRDASGPGIDAVGFWGRRFRRLLPAVFAMIGLVAVWVLLFGSAADLDGVRRDGPWAVVYLANWHLISESAGYWASFSQPSMFDHLWSLAIEEQFYLVWPLVVLAIFRSSRRPARTLAVVCGLGIGVSLVAMLWLYDGGDPTRVYMGTDTRAASLLVGALAATTPVRAAVTGLTARRGGRLDVLVLGLLAVVVGSWTVVDGASSEALYRGGLLAHSTACAVLVVVVATMPDDRVGSRMLGVRPLVWLGVISYGLYLWHWPVYVVLNPERVGFDGIGLLVVRVGVSLALAVVSFRLIESPIRFRAAWAQGRRGAIVLVASVAGLLALLLTLPEPASEIAGFDPTTVGAVSPPEADALASDVGPPRPSTAPAPTTPSATAPTSTGAEALAVPTSSIPRPTISSVLWAGDSVAFDAGLGIEAALADAGLRVDPSGAYYGTAVTKQEESLRLGTILPQKLAERPADTVVMLISTWDTLTDSAGYRSAVIELAGELQASGVQHLVIVSSPPVADTDTDAELDRLAEVAADLAATDERIWFIDSGPAWADPPVVDVNGDGAPERKRDLTHVCPAGAAGFGAWLAGELSIRFDGLTPVEPTRWAGGPWTTDPRYDQPVGSCAPVS